jgi:hypothetical protein
MLCRLFPLPGKPGYTGGIDEWISSIICIGFYYIAHNHKN